MAHRHVSGRPPLRVGGGLGGRLAACLLLASPALADPAPEHWEIDGQLELELTGYVRDPQFTGQDRDGLSVAGQATFLAEWLDGDLTLKITPFARFDIADDRRTHWDLREAKVDYTAGNWSITIGADTVFWGRTEALNLVDIINQTDTVEGLVDEQRLGQPMLRVGYLTEFGEFSAFYLPYFRDRTLPGVSGRLRSSLPVNTARPIYDAGAEEWTPSFALRYAGTFGDVDLGLSGFYGLSRDPALTFDGTSLRPVYDRVIQAGVDLQYTAGATLWKGEAIYRAGQKNASFREEPYFAVTGGVEHTLFGVADSNADLGLIAEYAWDSRGADATEVFQNDLILGVRLALNDEQDTSVLFTAAYDTTDGATLLRLEAERRIAPDWKISVEGLGLLAVDRASVLGGFADDSHLRLKLTYFFGTE